MLSTNQKNPFPGLRPYRSEEHDLFFGRANHTHEILRKLEQYRFVSVVGNSGCGKSSLIRAGVLPDFEKKADWRILRMQPGQDPSKALASSITSAYGGDAHDALDTILKGPLGLVQTLRSLAPKGENILLLIDQFEELFRFEEGTPNSGQTHFVRSILEATGQKDIPFFTIITIRSDFLGDCEQFAGLPEAINNGQFLVPRMNDEEMRECIVGPIQASGGKISPRLVQRLIQEVGNKPDQLPVLQHALMLAWNIWKEDQSPDQPIDVEHYEAIGTVRSALSRHAERVYDALDRRQQEIARKMFRTITLLAVDNRGVRRPTRLSSIARIADCTEEELIRVIEHFRHAENGFIMPPQPIALDADSMIDISHESLMRIWTKLNDWVDQEAESANLYRRICENAVLYEQGKASLWRDPDLQIALGWLEREQPNEYWASQYNDHYSLALKFIHSSKEEQAFAVLSRKRAIRFRNAMVLIALVILAVLSIWAMFERNNANASAQIALAEQQEADEQRLQAQTNLGLAVQQEKKANEHREDAEAQRALAESKALEAQAASLRALQASDRSDQARMEAEAQRSLALEQTEIAEQNRLAAEQAANRALQLRMRALAQNLAIRSKLIEEDKDLKALLALHAHRIHVEYGGAPLDKQIYEGLFHAWRSSQTKDQMGHRDHTAAIQSLCYLANGQLVSAGSDGFIHSHGPLGSFHSKEHRSPYTHLCAMGSDLVAVDRDLNIQVFAGGQLQATSRTWKSGHADQVIGLHFSDNKLVTISSDRTLRIWDRDGQLLRSVTMDHLPTASCYSGNKLLIGTATGQVLQLASDKEHVQVLGQFTQERITAVDENSGLLAIGTAQGNCILALSPEQRVGVLGHPAQISSILFLSGDSTIATSCLDGKVRLYRIDGQLFEPIVFEEHRSWVMDLAEDEERGILASCGKEDRSVKTYLLDQAALVQGLKTRTQRELRKEEWEFYLGEGLPMVPMLE